MLVSPTSPLWRGLRPFRRLFRHGHTDALHRVVHIAADVPCGLERLLVAGGISRATAKLVLTGLGCPHEAPRAPRPAAERCRAELRCRPGRTAVARDIDAGDFRPT